MFTYLNEGLNTDDNNFVMKLHGVRLYYVQIVTVTHHVFCIF